jgi:predicted transcriptional regulator
MSVLCVLIVARELAGRDKRPEPMRSQAASRWDAASERLWVARRMPSIWRWIAIATDVAILVLWLDQDKLVRDSVTGFFESKCHEVSVAAVCRLGMGGRIATAAIRPR